MTIRTCAEAIHVSLEQHTNIVGTCQANVRGWFNAPSVGDVDHDGDADAVDGWESEPKAYRYPGDRNPPDGVPLSFHGGSRGFGHRAMSGAKSGNVRSTDMNGNSYQPGVTGSVSASTRSLAIAIIEHQMGVFYTGWSKTIDGNLIPDFKKVTREEPRPQTRGARVDIAYRKMRKARALAIENHDTVKTHLLAVSIAALLRMPTHDKKR